MWTWPPASAQAGPRDAFLSLWPTGTEDPFFIILNVAVGGNWPGPPDDTTVFPQIMAVDYMRVYQPSR